MSIDVEKSASTAKDHVVEIAYGGSRLPSFERAGHFAYVALPGGEAAIRQPWRMAVSYLAHTFGEDLFNLDIPFVRDLPKNKAQTILRMIAQGVNAPLTSSCGRLFDAVAALIGVRQIASYEAQAAIELEMLARSSTETAGYPFCIGHVSGCWQIDPAPLFRAIVEDLRNKVGKPSISRRFHNGLTRSISRLASLLRQESSINQVCISGGTFNNVLLLDHLTRQLVAEGFAVFAHADVPAGDGGLSLGQALVAAHALGG